MLYSIKTVFLVLVFLQISIVNANDSLDQVDDFYKTKCFSLNNSQTYKSLRNINKDNKIISIFSKRLPCITPVFLIIALHCLTLQYFNIDNSTALLKTATQIFLINIILTIIKDVYISSDFLDAFVEYFQIFFDFLLPIKAGSNILHTVESSYVDNIETIDYIPIVAVQISSVLNNIFQIYSHFTVNKDDDEKNIQTKSALNFLIGCIQDNKDIFIYPELLKQSDKNTIFFENFCKWVAHNKSSKTKIEDMTQTTYKTNDYLIDKQFNLKISKISENKTLNDALLSSLLQKNSCLVLEATVVSDKENKSSYQYVAIANNGIKYFVLLGVDLENKEMATDFKQNLQLYMQMNSIPLCRYLSIIINFDSANELFSRKKDIVDAFGTDVNNINIFKFDQLTE